MQFADRIGQSVDQPDGVTRVKWRSPALTDVAQVLREADAFDPGQHHIDLAGRAAAIRRRVETNRL